MNSLLFKYEIKKVLSQTSTKVIIAISILFPLLLILGIIFPSENFSITMDDLSASQFANAILGFNISLGLTFIIISIISSSIVSREIDTKYIYLMLSAIPSPTKLYFYKSFAVTTIIFTTSFISSIIAYLSYSIFKLKDLSFSLTDIGIVSWGLLITTIICLIFMFIIIIINILSQGSIYASITASVVAIISLNLLTEVKSIEKYLPSFATDYIESRDNILIIVIYIVLCITLGCIMYLISRYKGYKI